MVLCQGTGVVYLEVRGSTRHTVAAVPRWEPETVTSEPETVNKKGLLVTKSLEAAPPLEVGGLKGPC
jgi:hypothetical protein